MVTSELEEYVIIESEKEDISKDNVIVTNPMGFVSNHC